VILKGREAALAFNEKEYFAKRKELDSWDEMLGDKDRRLAADRKILDEKLDTVRATEERQRTRETELDKRSAEVRVKESEVTVMSERYSRMLQELEVRERICLNTASQQHIQERNLIEKEESLNQLQEHLNVLESRLSVVESREAALQDKILAHEKVENEFYNVKVALIASRHAAELSELETIVAEQLKIAANFQADLERSKSELAEFIKEKASADAASAASALIIEKLQLDISALNAERKQLSLAEQQFHHDRLLARSIGQKDGRQDDIYNVDFAERDGEINDARQFVVTGAIVAGALSSESPSSQAMFAQLGATQRMLSKLLETHKVGRSADSAGLSSAQFSSPTFDASSRLSESNHAVASSGNSQSKRSSRKHRAPVNDVEAEGTGGLPESGSENKRSSHRSRQRPRDEGPRSRVRHLASTHADISEFNADNEMQIDDVEQTDKEKVSCLYVLCIQV
jgi:hypothetical protein